MLQSSKCCCRSPSKALKPLLGLLQSMQWWVPFQGFISLSSLLHMVTRQPCWLHTKFVHGKFAEFFWSVLAAGYMGAQARLHGNSRIILWIASARITPCTKGGCYLSFRELYYRCGARVLLMSDEHHWFDIISLCSLHHFWKTCFRWRKSTSLSWSFEMQLAPFQRHLPLIPGHSFATRKRPLLSASLSNT